MPHDDDSDDDDGNDGDANFPAKMEQWAEGLSCKVTNARKNAPGDTFY